MRTAVEGGWVGPDALGGWEGNGGYLGHLLGSGLGRCVSGLGRWTGSSFGQQVELGLGKPLGPAGAGRRGGGSVGEGHLRAGVSAKVPPQGGIWTPVLISMLSFPLTFLWTDVHLVPLWDRNVVMWEVGPCSSPGVAFGFWGKWCHTGKQVSWVWVAATGSRPLPTTPTSTWPTAHICGSAALRAPLRHLCFSHTLGSCPLCRHPGCPKCARGVNCSVVQGRPES